MTTNLPPRPWRYHREPENSPSTFRWNASGARRPVFNIYDANGQWIARAAADTPEQAEAIAKLIVAGPALLETRKMADQAVNMPRQFGDYKTMAVVIRDDVRAALDLSSLKDLPDA